MIENNRKHSEELYEKAQEVIVGGVNSPSRSYKAVGGGAPTFMERGEGAYFWDADGNKYIDYVAAYGPIITGHAHPYVTKAIQDAAADGVLYGASTRHELKFAQMIREAIPSMEKIRFVNSGTEAVMTTIRVARAYTGRDKIIKFAGCYHGHSDLVLVAAGSGPATLGTPDSAGVPKSIAKEVITVPYNDVESLEEAMNTWGHEIAAVILEPIVGNFGIVEPNKGFLEKVNEIAHAAGALVIYDEIITGFRFMYGGAQNLLGIEPDITAIGKIIGGGLPIGAYGGRKEIMEQVAPLGPAYQAGTMAGNPLSMRAGISCLEVLKEEDPYDRLDALGAMLEEGMVQAAEKHDIHMKVNRLKGAIAVYFGVDEVNNYEDAENSDGEMFAYFFKQMIYNGINLAPSKYEALFITMAHTEEDIKQTIKVVDEIFANWPK